MNPLLNKLAFNGYIVIHDYVDMHGTRTRFTDKLVDRDMLYRRGILKHLSDPIPTINEVIAKYSNPRYEIIRIEDSSGNVLYDTTPE